MSQPSLNNLDKSNWQTLPFGEIAQSIGERVDPTKTDLETYVGLEHIDPESIHIKRFGKREDVSGTKLRCYPGDVIFGRRRAYQRKAAICEFDGFCSAHSLVLRAIPEVIDPKLFPFFLHSDQFMHRAVDISVGGLSPTINWTKLKQEKFLLPPKDQQAKLAELLWAADAVVTKKNNLFESVNQTAETYIERNLTSPSVEGSLSDYCEKDGIKIGPFGSLLHKEDYQSNGIPVVMPADIVDGVIQEDSVARISEHKAEELKNYRLEEKDILFPRRGDLTKRALVELHQKNWICGTGTIRVRLKESINPLLVYYAVTSSTTNRRLLDSAVGTTMPNLNARAIKNIPLHLPSSDSSNRILSELELIFRSKAELHANLQNSRALLKSLINEIFSQPA